MLERRRLWRISSRKIMDNIAISRIKKYDMAITSLIFLYASLAQLRGKYEGLTTRKKTVMITDISFSVGGKRVGIKYNFFTVRF